MHNVGAGHFGDFTTNFCHSEGGWACAAESTGAKSSSDVFEQEKEQHWLSGRRSRTRTHCVVMPRREVGNGLLLVEHPS